MYSPEPECVAEDEDDDDADEDGSRLLRAALERHGPVMEVKSRVHLIQQAKPASVLKGGTILIDHRYRLAHGWADFQELMRAIVCTSSAKKIGNE